MDWYEAYTYLHPCDEDRYRGTEGQLHRIPRALADETSMCTPGEGYEKGGVEKEAGYFRGIH